MRVSLPQCHVPRTQFRMPNSNDMSDFTCQCRVRRHTTVRCRKVFYTALLCAASLWGGANLRLRRIPGCQRAPMGQPRGGRQLGTEAVWQVATEVRVLGCQARVLSMVRDGTRSTGGSTTI